MIEATSFLDSLTALLAGFDTDNFHFLRPNWLFAIPAGLILTIFLWRQKQKAAGWHKHIDSNLLEHLLDGQLTRAKKHQFGGVLAAWIIASIALAGPSWSKLPQPVHKSESARVILFDLSPSMQAEDLKPSRLVRARLKLIDLLQARDEGLNALIAYAGKVHVVTPLTDDTDTIINQLPALSPNIMPLAGSNTEMAVEQALILFKESGLTRGDILLVTDGVADIAEETIRELLSNSQYRLSILGAGTDEGAPIATGRGGFARDSSGAIVISKLNSGNLKALASDLGGRYSTLRSDGRDVAALNSLTPHIDQKTRKVEREFDSWQDAGQWLALLLLPLAWLSFRRGLVLPLLLLLPALPQPAAAFEWQDLWQTSNQQGQTQLNNGDAKAAAETFDDPDWQASANYRAGDFEQAAERFAESNSSSAHYNQANALAKAGKLEQALAAYDKALKQNPSDADAAFNRDIVEKIKQQQDQQQDQQNNDSQEESDDNSEQEDSEQQNSGQDQQNSGENNSDGDKQDGEQQNTNDSENQGEEQQSQGSDDPSQQGNPSQDQQNKQQPDMSQDQQQGDKSEQDAEQESEPNSPEEQQPKPEQDPQQDQEGQETDTQAAPQPVQLSPEEQAEQEELQQWLRGIPDDPGGLLRNKFRHQHQIQQRDAMRGRAETPDNGAAERW